MDFYKTLHSFCEENNIKFDTHPAGDITVRFGFIDIANSTYLTKWMRVFVKLGSDLNFTPSNDNILIIPKREDDSWVDTEEYKPYSLNYSKVYIKNSLDMTMFIGWNGDDTTNYQLVSNSPEQFYDSLKKLDIRLIAKISTYDIDLILHMYTLFGKINPLSVGNEFFIRLSGDAARDENVAAIAYSASPNTIICDDCIEIPLTDIKHVYEQLQPLKLYDSALIKIGVNIPRHYDKDGFDMREQILNYTGYLPV